jgi:hypothetical protein
MPVKPPTLFVNKAEIREEAQRAPALGRAQAAVAEGVLESVAERTIPQAEVDDSALIAAVWADWAPPPTSGGLRQQPRGNPRCARVRAEGRPRLEELLRSRGEPAEPLLPPRVKIEARSPRAPASIELDPPLQRGLGTLSRDGRSKPRSSSSRRTRALHRHRVGATRWTASSATRISSSARSARRRAPRGRPRDDHVHARPLLAPWRPALGISRERPRARPAARALGGQLDRVAAYALDRRAALAGRARRLRAAPAGGGLSRR